jgi:cyclophilin family peptidyl-prolyl cis-trans isomerase/protein-disulfide isomerase
VKSGLISVNVTIIAVEEKMNFTRMRTPCILSMILCLWLSACGSAVTQTSAPTTQSNPQQFQDYCTVVSSSEITLDPTEAAIKELVPPVSDTDWVDGPSTATVTIIEYVDFQCPGCSGLAPTMDQLRLDFPNDLRIVIRHFPNPVHDKSLLSSQAMEAAGKQGKFWEMKSALFQGQPEWSDLTEQGFKDWLAVEAVRLGLDPVQLLSDMESQPIVGKALAAREEAISLGIPYTPFLVINGTMYQGPREYASLKDVIKLLLLEERQVTGCPPFTIDTAKQYIATIVTEKGNIVIQLYPDKAPMAVNSFVYLADHGYFDGITFHRVLKGVLAQTGDPSGTGYGGPGYAFPNEIDDSLQYDSAGVVGMANAGADTNGSQFFITMTAMPNLNGNYSIFGKVIRGMEVVRSLSERDLSLGAPLTEGDKILTITIEVK